MAKYFDALRTRRPRRPGAPVDASSPRQDATGEPEEPRSLLASPVFWIGGLLSIAIWIGLAIWFGVF